MATQIEEDAGRGRWDTALTHAITLNSDAAFIIGWLRSQADYRLAGDSPAAADTWDPPAEPPLENISEPLSGTLDADLPVVRE